MQSRSEKAEAEPFVEGMAAMNAQRRCEVRRPVSATNWEDRLSDFEWIDLLASIFSVELANRSNTTPRKH